MKHFKDLKPFDLPIKINTIKTNKGVSYLNIESGFDIETTSIINDGKKGAFMYIWMFGLGHENDVVYGRTWEEFLEFKSTIIDRYNINLEKRLIVYIHNLGFEFQFMRKYFEWYDVFATGERKPLKAVTKDGIEFRDSYMLSGYSLEKTSENLVNHKIEKLVGELDYSKIRTYKTEMTEQELKYCENDIKIITAYIDEQIEQYGNISKIPLTNTGRVRNYVRHNCYYTNRNHKKSNTGKYNRYRKIMNDLTLQLDDYKQLKRAFMGGFTHANSMYSGETLENVSSVDFSSAYPSVMLSEKFPMSRPKKITVESIKHLDYLCNRYGMLFDIELTNVQSKIPQENYISESKCFLLENPLINNGRVYSADRLRMTVTNVDYDIMKQCYNWNEIKVVNAKYFHLGYLPKDVIDSVLNLYEKKTELKGVQGKEVEYMLSKGMLNSVYGMTVTDIIKDNHIYNENWEVDLVDENEELEKHNKSKNRFLYFPWGVWITAYTRRNLWSGIIEMGNDYVYSDTDSIKLLNIQNYKDYFTGFNMYIVDKMKNMCDYYKFDVKRLSPKNKLGEIQTIGLWDFEGTYERFKTLGAKRYLVQEKDNLTLTVAGLSKQNGIHYMIEKCNGNYDEVFKMFNDDLYIPSNRTGKMTHTYIDDEHTFNVIDYKGIETKIKTESGIHLENCDFTLSISKQYGEFLNNLKHGYIYRGVKYV